MKKGKGNLLTDAVTHPQVVTLAVFNLGGEDRFVDTEDVAQEAARLAPGRFSWRKYPDQINLELVRVYLSDAKKTAHGSLLNGSGRRGWILTAAGLSAARAVSKQLGEGSLARDPAGAHGGSVTIARRDRELKRLQGTVAWQKWIGSAREDISEAEAQEVFRIDSYAVGDMRQLKIERVRKMFADNQELVGFLNSMIGRLS